MTPDKIITHNISLLIFSPDFPTTLNFNTLPFICNISISVRRIFPGVYRIYLTGQHKNDIIRANHKRRKLMSNNKNTCTCESCEFYGYDDDYGDYICNVALDEDEMADFLNKNTKSCPYYRFYDEYKSVRKQN